MEHYDKFWDDEYICWVEVKDIPQKFIKQAKQIDGDNYSEDCFGICVSKGEDDGWCVCQDAPGCELYYIDIDGEKHWMKYVLSEAEYNNAINFCEDYVKYEEC